MSGVPRNTVASNTVWLSPSATSYSCLCEECLEAVRGSVSFLDGVQVSIVRGTIARECEVAFARCRAGHELVLRRGSRPAALLHADERQLQLT